MACPVTERTIAPQLAGNYRVLFLDCIAKAVLIPGRLKFIRDGLLHFQMQCHRSWIPNEK